MRFRTSAFTRASLCRCASVWGKRQGLYPKVLYRGKPDNRCFSNIGYPERYIVSQVLDDGLHPLLFYFETLAECCAVMYPWDVSVLIGLVRTAQPESWPSPGICDLYIYLLIWIGFVYVCIYYRCMCHTQLCYNYIHSVHMCMIIQRRSLCRTPL